jgi:predicted nucleotidyltransferase
MSNIVLELQKKGLAHPPPWLPMNTMFLGITGSVAYGVSSDTSDNDVYGFCMPPKELVFPHLSGEIPGFGRQIQRFEQYQEHHIVDPSARKEYDLTVF